MDPISRIRTPAAVNGQSPAPPSPAPWKRAAETAYAVARQRTPNPATPQQLGRVCQLLTSHTVRERERRRALLRLTQGCTKPQASAMLDYLLPAVQARKAEEARAFLAPVTDACGFTQSDRHEHP
jgi:hypothetical protein